MLGIGHPVTEAETEAPPAVYSLDASGNVTGLVGPDESVVLEVAEKAGDQTGFDVVMRSPIDPLDDTLRTRYISYQKQEPENDYNGGEPIWIDTAPLADVQVLEEFVGFLSGAAV